MRLLVLTIVTILQVQASAAYFLPHQRSQNKQGMPRVLKFASLTQNFSCQSNLEEFGGGGGIQFPPRGGGGGGGDGGRDNEGGNNKVVELYASYQELLKNSPLITKSVSSGILTLVGDVIAQWLESRVEGYCEWNLVRMAAFTVAGTLFVGPFVHYWYEVLWAMGRRLDARGFGRWTKTLTQVGVDQSVGVALFFPCYFYIYELCEAVVMLRRANFNEAGRKCRKDLGGILVNQYKVWPIINLVSFSMVPENLRVLFSNTASVFWNAYLCTQIGT
ncbi:hypothetical protein TrST_g6182 [Triparma strigata]|uniref:Uncharacterized protein n=1 Tax=Triparma strigata TaxID=1606541 RepID=A0A9W7C674_9STRA|nr:hypothetical protein TrST_g6182 [Triparma strigata]